MTAVVETQGITEELGAFVAHLAPDGMPEDLRAQARALLIDACAAGLSGQRMPWVGKLRRSLEPISGAPVSSILFSDARIDPVRAAYLNGVIAGGLAGDAIHPAASVHPGAVVWPAAIAVGEMTGAAATDILAAVIVGSEIMIRISLAVQPHHAQRGFPATATCGVFGAAAAAAKLFGLGPAGVTAALGIAASYAGGLVEATSESFDIGHLHAGKAAAGGVEAALFARTGLTGPHDILEGTQGFGRAMARGLSLQPIRDGLGSNFHFMDLAVVDTAGRVGKLMRSEDPGARFRTAAEGAFPVEEISRWLDQVAHFGPAGSVRDLMALRLPETIDARSAENPS